MLTADDSRIARQFKTRLQNEMSIKRVLVYGSRARGEANPWSDLDLYVEPSEPVTASQRKRIRELAWEIGLDANVVISTLVHQNSLRGQPILKAIEREGVAV